jgi:hypothetical protein
MAKVALRNITHSTQEPARMPAIRNARAQQSRMVRHVVRTTDAHAFFNLLTDDSTLDQVEVQLPMHRERLLPPTETLAMWY